MEVVNESKRKYFTVYDTMKYDRNNRSCNMELFVGTRSFKSVTRDLGIRINRLLFEFYKLNLCDHFHVKFIAHIPTFVCLRTFE